MSSSNDDTSTSTNDNKQIIGGTTPTATTASPETRKKRRMVRVDEIDKSTSPSPPPPAGSGAAKVKVRMLQQDNGKGDVLCQQKTSQDAGGDREEGGRKEREAKDTAERILQSSGKGESRSQQEVVGEVSSKEAAAAAEEEAGGGGESSSGNESRRRQKPDACDKHSLCRVMEDVVIKYIREVRGEDEEDFVPSSLMEDRHIYCEEDIDDEDDPTTTTGRGRKSRRKPKEMSMKDSTGRGDGGGGGAKITPLPMRYLYNLVLGLDGGEPDLKAEESEMRMLYSTACKEANFDEKEQWQQFVEAHKPVCLVENKDEDEEETEKGDFSEECGDDKSESVIVGELIKCTIKRYGLSNKDPKIDIRWSMQRDSENTPRCLCGQKNLTHLVPFTTKDSRYSVPAIMNPTMRDSLSSGSKCAHRFEVNKTCSHTGCPEKVAVKTAKMKEELKKLDEFVPVDSQVKIISNAACKKHALAVVKAIESAFSVIATELKTEAANETERIIEGECLEKYQSIFEAQKERIEKADREAKAKYLAHRVAEAKLKAEIEAKKLEEELRKSREIEIAIQREAEGICRHCGEREAEGDGVPFCRACIYAPCENAKDKCESKNTKRVLRGGPHKQCEPCRNKDVPKCKYYSICERRAGLMKNGKKYFPTCFQCNKTPPTH